MKETNLTDFFFFLLKYLKIHSYFEQNGQTDATIDDPTTSGCHEIRSSSPKSSIKFHSHHIVIRIFINEKAQ